VKQRTLIGQIKLFVMTLIAWLALGLAVVPAMAQTEQTGQTAQTTNGDSTETSTSEIFTNTISGVGSCFRWQPKGICVWLVCSWYECHVEETLRIEHYTPDTTISTFHDAETHPWKDYGRKIAKQTTGASSWMIGKVAGGALAAVVKPDSAGTKTKGDRDSRNYIYRGADAIGNPVSIISGIITGNWGLSGSGPERVPFPLPYELAQWFTDFPQQVADQWSSIGSGSDYNSEQTQTAQEQTSAYSNSLGLGNVAGTAGKIVGLYNQAMGSYTTDGSLNIGGESGSSSSSGNSKKDNTNSQGSSGGSNSDPGDGGGSEYMCPTGLMPFGLAFQSDLDSFFWRGLVPLESIYPATWLPGMREVGSGILQTWGNVWQRSGALFQPHPVKAAAVIAQRVGDIISYHKQPHIYSRLQLDTDANYRFFGFQGIREHDEKHTIWQRLFPNAQKDCSIFGTNDSLAIFGFGDGQNINSRGTVWNAWRKQDCCKKYPGGGFLFSIP
jgi:integrating conjugative element protein (TIGR03756 family)